MASSETPGAVDDRSERFLSRKVLDARSSQGASKVWAEVTALARLPGVLDLGQGWPDFGANDVARNAASDALVRSPDPRANQYSPITGAPELLTAISRYYRATGSADVGTPSQMEFGLLQDADEPIFVADLDVYFTQIYEYWYHSGFATICVSRLVCVNFEQPHAAWRPTFGRGEGLLSKRGRASPMSRRRRRPVC